MYIQSQNYDKYIQKVRINVGTYVGLEKDEDAFVTLKEMPTMDMMKLRKVYSQDETEVMNFFKEVLPRIIVDHNFYETEQKKMTTDKLTNLIFESIELSSKVMGDYSSASFFTHKKKTGSK